MSERGGFARWLWRRLRALASAAPPAAPLPDHATLLARLDVIEGRLLELAARQPEPHAVDAGVQAALAALEKQIGRAGREQLKLNALAEAQLEQLQVALDALRAADLRREDDLAALRASRDADQRAERRAVVRELLPAIDGLDQAANAGLAVLAQHTPPPVPPTIVARMRAHTPLPQQEQIALREAMAAWLGGIELVRQRLLDVLAAEGIQPILAFGQPFDPVYHVAVEVVPPTEHVSPGIVAAEIRRGYTVDGRVLRPAEVAVARAAMAVGASSPGVS